MVLLPDVDVLVYALRSVIWTWLDTLRSSPLHRFVSAGPRHADLVKRRCAEGDATGNLVSDAVI